MTTGGGEADALLARIARAAAGDAAAQDELVREFYPRVRGVVHRELQRDFRQQHRWMLPLFSTRDVVQDVFAEVIRGLDGCEFAGEEPFVAYLCTVVRHRLLDAVRFFEAQRRDSRRNVAAPTSAEGLGPASGPSPSLAVALGEQARVLREVFDTFPERHRALLEMRLVDEVKFPVIAAKLGYSSAETARQAFLDAKAKLLVRLRGRGVKG